MLKSFVFLLIGIVVCYLTVTFVFCNISYSGVRSIHYTNNYSVRIGGNTYRQFHEFNPNEAYDIVFLGASKALKSYDPHVFSRAGLKTYNLASHVQHAPNSAAVVKHFLNSNNCRHIFYEITDELYSNPLVSTVQSDIDMMTNTCGTDIAKEIAFRSPNPKYFNVLFIRGLQIKPQISEAEEGYAGLGFVGLTNTLDEGSKRILKIGSTKKPDKIEWADDKIEELKSLIQLVKSKNIKLTGIYGPVSSRYPNERVEGYVEYMRKVFQEYDCDFWDFGKLNNIQDELHYSDVNHLNAAGAALFSDTLAKYFLLKK